jgi:hypothetical protein
VELSLSSEALSSHFSLIKKEITKEEGEKAGRK